ncbi:MAG: hypothetical protein QOF51_3850, partial [Chloroflexota bacterium]|nr:hypothetical protein [Chloroflexota bacterium]
YRLIRERKLAATQIGRAYRVPHEDLEAFLGAHSSRPEVRAAILRDFMKIADARPGLDSDAVLEELEREDAAARVQPQPV